MASLNIDKPQGPKQIRILTSPSPPPPRESRGGPLAKVASVAKQSVPNTPWDCHRTADQLE